MTSSRLAHDRRQRAIGIALAFAPRSSAASSICVNGARRHALRATRPSTRRRRTRSRARCCSCSLLPRSRSRGRVAASSVDRARRWLALLAVAVHRRQRPVRPLLRRSRARRRRRRHSSRRRSSSGSRCSPFRCCGSGSGWRTRSRSACCSAGQAWLAGNAGTRRLRHGRGDDPRRDAALVGRGRLRQAAPRRRSPPRVLAAARMALGTVLLVGWLAVSGKSAEPARALGGEQWRLGAADGAAAHRLRRHLVRGARARAGHRRDGGARLRRRRDRDAVGSDGRDAAIGVGGTVLITLGTARRRARGAAPRSARPSCVTVTAGAAPLRALRVPAERARPLRRRRARARCSSTATRGRVGRRPRRARADVRGRLAVPDADRGREPASPTRSTRASSRRTGSATTCSSASPPATLARHVDDRFRGRLGAAREHRRRRGRGRRGPAPLLPRVRGLPVARAAAERDRRRAAPRPRPVPDDAGARPRGRGRLGDGARAAAALGGGTLGSASRTPRRVRWRDDGLALVHPPATGRAGLAALGLRLRRPHGRARRARWSGRRGARWPPPTGRGSVGRAGVRVSRKAPAPGASARSPTTWSAPFSRRLPDRPSRSTPTTRPKPAARPRQHPQASSRSGGVLRCQAELLAGRTKRVRRRLAPQPSRTNRCTVDSPSISEASPARSRMLWLFSLGDTTAQRALPRGQPRGTAASLSKASNPSRSR